MSFQTSNTLDSIIEQHNITNNINDFNGNIVIKCRNHSANGRLVFSYSCFFEEFKENIEFRTKFYNYCIVVILTIILNGFVIITNTGLDKLMSCKTAHTRKGRNTNSILYHKTRASFASNAIADMIVGTFVMTFNMISSLFQYWPYTVNMCILWSTLDFVCGSSSMFHMCIIAFDRFMSLKNPLKHNNCQVTNTSISLRHKDFRIHVFRLIFAWLLAVVAWVPLVVPVLKKQNQIDYETCNFHLTAYVVIPHSILIYFLPMAIIVFLYLGSFYYLRKNVRNFVSTSNGSKTDQTDKSKRKNVDNKFEYSNICTTKDEKAATTITTPNNTTNDSSKLGNTHIEDAKSTSDAESQVLECSKKYLKVQPSDSCLIEKHSKRSHAKQMALVNNETRVIKRLALITGSFLICWLPWIIIWNYQSVYGYESIPEKIYTASFWMAYANSLINPLAIILTNTRYQKKIKTKVIQISRIFKSDLR